MTAGALGAALLIAWPAVIVVLAGYAAAIASRADRRRQRRLDGVR